METDIRKCIFYLIWLLFWTALPEHFVDSGTCYVSLSNFAARFVSMFKIKLNVIVKLLDFLLNPVSLKYLFASVAQR